MGRPSKNTPPEGDLEIVQHLLSLHLARGWERKANCRGKDNPDDAVGQRGFIRDFCGPCTVKNECLMQGISFGESVAGAWGGHTSNRVTDIGKALRYIQTHK